jgi:hypothetical protein
MLFDGHESLRFSRLRSGSFCCTALGAFRNQQVVGSIPTAGSNLTCSSLTTATGVVCYHSATALLLFQTIQDRFVACWQVPRVDVRRDCDAAVAEQIAHVS